MYQYSKNVFVHNPKTNTWQECAATIHGRLGLCTVTTDQHIYCIGGQDEDKKATHTVQRFDPRSNTWLLVSSMMEKRKFLCGAAFNNNIFEFGGVSIPGPTHSAEMHDIEEDQWQKIANMQVPRALAGAAVVQGLIYITGGNTPLSSAPEEHKRIIECHDPSTGQWAEKGLIPCEELTEYCVCCPVMIPKNLLKSLPEMK